MKVFRKVSLILVIITTMVIINQIMGFVTSDHEKLIQAQSNNTPKYPAPVTSTSLYPGPATATNVQITTTTPPATTIPSQTISTQNQTTPTLEQNTPRITLSPGMPTISPGTTYIATSTITATVTLLPLPTITLLFPKEENILSAKQSPGEAALAKQMPGGNQSGISRFLPFMVLVGVWGILGVLLLFSLWKIE